jgi:hypothetical protein
MKSKCEVAPKNQIEEQVTIDFAFANSMYH